jgi:ribosomal protein L35AE/L33A
MRQNTAPRHTRAWMEESEDTKANRPNTSLIKIEGVDDTKAATFYNGKRIAYVYRGKTEVRGTKIRVIWGKVTRPHGMFIQLRSWARSHR